MNPFLPPDYEEIQKRIKNEGGSNYWGGYFKQGIYGATPSQKKSFYGRILPMFDYFNLSPVDMDFPMSWAPYRDKNKINQETGQPSLNSFFGIAYTYSWFGNKSVSFVSPSSRRFTEGVSRGHDCIDPVIDIRNYAKKHEDSKVRALTEREENKKDAKVILPYPSLRYFFNFYGSSSADRTMRNYVIDVSKKAFEDLATKLGEWRPAHEQIIDPNWENYLFGDITDPQTGLAVETTSIPSNPQPFNGFVLASGSHKSLKNVRSVPVPKDCLPNRAQFFGPNNCFKLMSAQEIVDFLVEDGSIPYFLIQEVCSNYANVPPQPKTNVMVSYAESEEEEAYIPSIPTRSFTPPSNPEPVVKPTPAPKQVSNEAPVYWYKEGPASPVKKTKAEAMAALRTVDPDTVKVCLVGSNKWVHPFVEGLAEPKAPEPVVEDEAPPPLDDDAPPPFEVDEAPPVKVVASAAPVVAVKAGKESGLTKEMEAELAVLEEEFGSQTANMNPMRLVRMTHLRKLAGKTTILP